MLRCVHLVREIKIFYFHCLYKQRSYVSVSYFSYKVFEDIALLLRSWYKKARDMSNAFPWLDSSSQFNKTYKLCKHSNVLTNPRLLLVHYLNLQQKDIYRKRKCWKFAGVRILRFSCVTVSCKVACASKRNMLFPIKIMHLPSFMLFSKSLCTSVL